MSPVTYDPNAKAPRWKRFVSEVMGESTELITYLQRVVGYCMTGDTSEQAFFVFYGTGANGKSTFLEVIRAVLGNNYAQQMPVGTWLKRKEGGDSGAPSPDIARR